MRLGFNFLITLVITAVFAMAANAQTCNGSLGAPVINETFGHGNPLKPAALQDGTLTTLPYASDICGGEDGTYTLLTNMGPNCKGGTWQAIAHDHTNEPGVYGYMMVINASLTPSVFFTYNVKGSQLCPNTTYQFAVWIMNILRDMPQTQGYSQPDIEFRIERPDGSVLKIDSTGIIPPSVDPAPWIQYHTLFITPADGSDFVVKLMNKGKGGNGNDLAIDDITFSPCGPLIETGFETIGNITPKNTCEHDNLSYTLVAQQSGYNDPTYQWQLNKNDGTGWINIPNETSLSLKVNLPDAAADEYQYRIGVLNKANVGAEQCRIFSDPLTINVSATPVITLSSTTSTCIGNILHLVSGGGDSYEWTGPNNFTANENSPVVTYKAILADAGVYTVKVTKNGCPFFASTTVTVYPAIQLEPLKDVPICLGDSTQLTTVSQNATHFEWVPATGLDHADIANPIASPKATTTYTLGVTNDGCPDVRLTQSITISVFNKPVANAGNNIRMFDGDTYKINGAAAGDKISYYWTPSDYLDNPNSLTPITSSPVDITYTLHVESAIGCRESTSSVFVRVYKRLTVVNSFSPNNDGINDYWNIKNIDNYPKAEISVFTRYGQRVFHSIGYGKPWDGNFNGSKLSPGTYYYIIDLKDDFVPKQSGWVYIVR